MAFLVTFSAGLATVLGAFLVSVGKKVKLESCSLAFATGIMLSISLTELLPESVSLLDVPLSILMFFAGGLVSLIIDFLLPHSHGHGEEEPGHYISECECTHSHDVSMVMIIALVLHNIIEGLVTGITASNNIRFGWALAIGIALHNIPIGLTLSESVVSSGKKKAEAVLICAAVGMTQPLGALIGMLLFGHGSHDNMMGILMAVTSGILVYISFNELWPAVREYNNRKATIIMLFLGIIFIPVLSFLF